MHADIQSDVRAFMTGPAQQRVRDVPIDGFDVATLEALEERSRWLLEEADELREAFFDRDLPDIIDGATDVIYVAVGFFAALGVDFNECWAEVQRSNMTKEPGDESNGFKARKGAKFSRADLAGVIERLRAKATTSPLAVPHDLMADEPTDFGAINAASAASVAQLGEAWAKQDDAKAEGGAA